jgi:hypothetical protein
VKSSIDILMGLKVEEVILEQEHMMKQAAPVKKRRNNAHGEGRQAYSGEEDDDNHYINSSRGGHGAPVGNLAQESDRPNMSELSSSLVTSREGPPKEYEEII